MKIIAVSYDTHLALREGEMRLDLVFPGSTVPAIELRAVAAVLLAEGVRIHSSLVGLHEAHQEEAWGAQMDLVHTRDWEPIARLAKLARLGAEPAAPRSEPDHRRHRDKNVRQQKARELRRASSPVRQMGRR